MERRLAAILAADVVGYTRLMGIDETGTLRRLTKLREQVLEPLIREHRGQKRKKRNKSSGAEPPYLAGPSRFIGTAL